jgi:hypothetical protein
MPWPPSRQLIARRSHFKDSCNAPPRPAFTLQSVVLEYVTDRLVEEVSDEIAHSRPVQLVAQPLVRAQVKVHGDGAAH